MTLSLSQARAIIEGTLAAGSNASFKPLTVVVHEQQGSDPGYRPMAPSYDGEAFRAAHDLVFDGLSQPSGYTEPILHHHRRVLKGDES
jgi:malate synthase